MKPEDPHVIDFTEPLATWTGYYCPKSDKRHKDGTSYLHNLYCIMCNAQLHMYYGPVAQR